MAEILKHSQSSASAAFYYVRLKTYNGVSLFELEGIELEVIEPEGIGPEGIGPEEPPFKPVVSSHQPLAKVVADELRQVGTSYKGIALDQWVLEPDSLHVLVSLQSDYPKQPVKKGKPTLLTAFVAGLKAATAKRINLIRNEPGSPVWQRSYQEQRIEDDMMLFRLRKKLNDSAGMPRS